MTTILRFETGDPDHVQAVRAAAFRLGFVTKDEAGWLLVTVPNPEGAWRLGIETGRDLWTRRGAADGQ